MKIAFITSGVTSVSKSVMEKFSNELSYVIECPPRSLLKGKLKEKNEFIAKSLLAAECKKKALNYRTIFNCDEIDLYSDLKKSGIDLIVVFSMSKLLKKEIIELPKLGIVNLHLSLLPNYRGPNSILWVYFNQDKISGVTVHYIDEKEDTGNIIEQAQFHVPRNLLYKDYLDLAINQTGAPLLVKIIGKILNGEKVITQNQIHLEDKCRAKNVSIDEYNILLNEKISDCDQKMHFLCGTLPLFRNLLLSKKMISKFHVIGDKIYIKKSDKPKNAESMTRNNSKIILHAENGDIIISLENKIIKKIKNVFG